MASLAAGQQQRLGAHGIVWVLGVEPGFDRRRDILRGGRDPIRQVGGALCLLDAVDTEARRVELRPRECVSELGTGTYQLRIALGVVLIHLPLRPGPKRGMAVPRRCLLLGTHAREFRVSELREISARQWPHANEERETADQ